MKAGWNAESVLALAPDPGSVKAGEGLASSKKWANLGSGEGLIWGECQGSGTNPYQTKVDPDGPAFSCSCPSRKFPCKHALGLMLIWARGPATLAEGPTPPWVASWKEGREKKAEKVKEKAESGPKPVDLVARAKREAARSAKVAAGLDDLSLWLSDLVRKGFTSLAAKANPPWEELARRMVDAQAPGVARRLRQVDEMGLAGDGWQAALLDRLARLHLLGEGFRRQADLPAEVAADVLSTIGFPTDLDAVRAGPGVRDRWQVIGQAVAVEDKLKVLRTWLIGRDTGRPALVLDFAAGGQTLDFSLPPGVVVDADLAFFPGSAPLRALIKERHDSPDTLESPTGGTSISGAFAAYGSALAKNPWLELYPVVLDSVILLEHEGDWSARDGSGAVVRLSKRFGMGWHLLALEGGVPLTLCGEFDGATLEALSSRAGGMFFPLVNPEASAPGSSLSSGPVVVPLLADATASALVGVDRRPPTEPAADDPVGLALAGLEVKDPPARLLAVAAASSLYGRVGRKPAIDRTPPPAPCPADDQPKCLPEQAERLHRLLSGEHPDCLPEWITLLAASGRRLPYDAIVAVLSASVQPRIDAASLKKALGVRGAWLASKNPKWRTWSGREAGVDPTVVWETGSLDERLAVLRDLRAHDPGRGRELVASTFATDPADQSAAFLGAFARGLSMDDEPFLEAALDDRGKEVRRQAAERLRALPGSRLCLRMIERAREVLSWEGGKLVVEPSKACDKAMVRDGIEPTPPAHLRLGERAWWLMGIVSAVPTAAVAAMLGTTPAEIVEANRGGEWEAELWWAWSTAAIWHRDPDWAEPLLDAGTPKHIHLGSPSPDEKLLAVLPAVRRDSFLLRLFRAGPGALDASKPAARLIQSLTGPLGVEAAREVLREVRAIVAEERVTFDDPERRAALPKWSGRKFDRGFHEGHTIAFIEGLDRALPLELTDEASEGVAVDAFSDLAYSAVYATMIDRLRFRRVMHQEFS